MSDLANSCEYLTIEKLCSAVLESEKARASREIQCQNDEKTTCCYLCLSRRECAAKCRFLGNIESEPSPIKAEKIETENTFIDQKPETNQTENPAVCCPLCNVEMSEAKTKFRITGWEGPHPKLVGDVSSKREAELLPVIVCVCPQCGKIELKTDGESLLK